MAKEFNDYPALEKKYGELAFEFNQIDMEFINKITENNNKMIERVSKIPKPRKRTNKTCS